MTKNVWVISDTHFSHKQILSFRDAKGNLNRGSKFSNVNEMNEYMLHQWNSVVKTGDRVYHLGDVFMGAKEDFSTLWPKFNGRKNLICGNHDDIKYIANGGFFSKIQLWRMMPEFGLVLSHVPIHKSSIKKNIRDDKLTDFQKFMKRNLPYVTDKLGINRKTLLNVHGHTHEHGSPKGPYKSVCVELTDYTPINIEELRVT